MDNTKSSDLIPDNPDVKNGRKRVIIHADDFGMCHSVNKGIIETIENGYVNSVSLMPCCQSFDEAIEYARHKPGLDLGIHLTLTGEWSHYKWPPVSSITHVRSLVDTAGFFYQTTDQVLTHVSMKEIETELRAQIEKVLDFGVKVTHIDTHMFACLASVDIAQLYIKLGDEYKLPFLLDKTYLLNQLPELNFHTLEEQYTLADFVFTAPPEMYAAMGSLSSCYERVLRGFPHGLLVLLVHPGMDDSELRQITNNQVAYGSAWRQEDVNFFTSDHCKKLLDEEAMVLTTWHEVKEMTLPFSAQM